MTCGVGVTIPFFQQKQRIIHKKNRVKKRFHVFSHGLRFDILYCIFFHQPAQGFVKCRKSPFRNERPAVFVGKTMRGRGKGSNCIGACLFHCVAESQFDAVIGGDFNVDL